MATIAQQLDEVRGHIAGARTILWRLTREMRTERTPASVRFLLVAVEETLATSHRLLDLVIGIVPELVTELEGGVLNVKESNRSNTGGTDAAGPARPGDDVSSSSTR